MTVMQLALELRLQLRPTAAILNCVRWPGLIFAALLGVTTTTTMTTTLVRAAPPPVQGPRYSPPALPAVAANQLDILGVEIQQNNLPDAVRRLDSLLHDTPDAVLPAPDGGGTITLATWADALSGEQRKLLAKEYDAQFGEGASRAVHKLDGKGSAEPAEFLAIARRYPFATAANDAIASAARRCGELGDAASMHDLLDLAKSRGWKQNDPAPSDPPKAAA